MQAQGDFCPTRRGGRLMKRMILSLAIALAVALPAVAAADVIHINYDKFTFTTTMFNPCALNGVGENVALTITFDGLEQRQENDNSVSGVAIFRANGDGVGLTSGDRYVYISNRHPDPYHFNLQN